MRSLTPLRGLILAGSLMFTATAGPITSSAIAENSQEEAALTALNDQFNAYAEAYDLNGFLSLYDPEILWIAPGEHPSPGYEEPSKTFQFLIDQKGMLSHTIDHLFISQDGSQAVMIGDAIIKAEPAGLDATGTYLFVLKQQDGEWQIIVDMFHQHTKTN